MTMILLLWMGTKLNLTLNEEVTLTREDVLLADVLTEASQAALDSQDLLQARVARGPGFGSARNLHRDLIAQFIQTARPDLELSFSGPNATLVRRAGGTFSPQAVEQAVRDYIALLGEELQLTIEVVRVQIPKILKIPAAPIVYRVRERPNHPLIGRQAFYVDLLVDGQNFQTVVVPVELAQKARVAVARHDLKRGDLLGPNDISWEERDVQKSNAALLREGEDTGLRMRMAVRAGTFLNQQHTETQPLVERRQNVYVTAQRGPLTITLRAEALDNGGRGESIRLKNLESGQLLRGTVVDAGMVQLDF